MSAKGFASSKSIKAERHEQQVDKADYLDAAAEAVRRAQTAAAKSVNLAMVYAYFEIGRIVVEEEQAGSSRAGYGKQVIARVSARLTEEFGRGFSMTNIEQMRKFYRVYAHDTIPQKPSEEFSSSLTEATSTRKFFLSWSHYLKLMRIDDVDKWHFYEIEAARGGWSLAELQRQYGALLRPQGETR